MKQCKVGMDQENIISTFASTQFYGDPDAYIREFLQNAIDACNTRAALEWSWGTEFLEMEEARALNSMRNPYSPQISSIIPKRSVWCLRITESESMPGILSSMSPKSE